MVLLQSGYYFSILIATLAVAKAQSVAVPGRITIPLKKHEAAANDAQRSLHSEPLKPPTTTTHNCMMRSKPQGPRLVVRFVRHRRVQESVSVHRHSLRRASYNPGVYKPSSESIDLNATGVLGYGSGKVHYGFWNLISCGVNELQYNTYMDTISLSGLVVKNQTFASLVENASSNDYTTRFVHDGIAGMSIGSFLKGAPSDVGWFDHLCNEGQLEECRYGLAFGTQGTRKQIFDGIDGSLFDELTPVAFPHGWRANVVINGTKTLFANREMHNFDTGTPDVVVNISDAQAIFDHFGIQVVEYPAGWHGCLQFLMPNRTSDEYTNGPVFHIEPEAFKLVDDGNNNCTAVVWGTESDNLSWLVGQAWFQGRYIDQHRDGVLTGVATLKDKTVPI